MNAVKNQAAVAWRRLAASKVASISIVVALACICLMVTGNADRWVYLIGRIAGVVILIDLARSTTISYRAKKSR